MTLAEALRAQGGALAEHALGDGDGGPLELAGPRTEGREAEYGLLLEMIREGSRLHYGTPQAVATDDDDLRLLLGDQLYALGLARLAALGDVEAVAELADVISLVAQAHAGGDEGLADAVWEAGAAAIAWGSSAQHRAAKALARAGGRRAIPALRESRPDTVRAGRGKPCS